MNSPPGSSTFTPKSKPNRRRLILTPPDHHVDVRGRCGIEEYLSAKELYRRTASGFVLPPAPYEESRASGPIYGLIASQQSEIAAIIKRSGVTVDPDTDFSRGAKRIWPIGRPHMLIEALIIKTTDTTGQDKVSSTHPQFFAVSLPRPDRSLLFRSKNHYKHFKSSKASKVCNALEDYKN